MPKVGRTAKDRSPCPTLHKEREGWGTLIDVMRRVGRTAKDGSSCPTLRQEREGWGTLIDVMRKVGRTAKDGALSLPWCGRWGTRLSQNCVAGACDHPGQLSVDSQTIDAARLYRWKLAPILEGLKYTIRMTVPQYLDCIAGACFALEPCTFRLRDSMNEGIGMGAQRMKEVDAELLDKR